MNYFDFMNEHSFIGFLLTAGAIGTVCRTVFNIWNRLMRHLNVRKAGWPPPHLDADGDFKQQDEQ